MKTSLGGRLRNIQVGKDRPLLPLFEAVINSFQSIDEARSKGLDAGSIRIEIHRDLPNLEGEAGAILALSITDDGIGFDSVNYQAFCESDTLHKEGLGGKGIGRLSWLKVFHTAEVNSVFLEGDDQFKRSFTFSLNNDPICDVVEDARGGPRQTTIRLSNPRKEYLVAMPIDSDEIGQAVVEHCVPMLLRNEPLMVLVDGVREIDLNEYFRAYRRDRAETFNILISESEFEVTVFRAEQGFHKLSFAANGRQVRAERLQTQIVGLPARLGDENPFVVHAYVEGTLLDSTVDPSRGSFDLPASGADQSQGLFKVPSLDAIRAAAVDKIEETIQPEMQVHLQKVKTRVMNFVSELRPEHMLITGHLDEVANRIPAGASNEQLDTILSRFAADLSVERRKRADRALSKVHKGGEQTDEMIDALLREVTEQDRMNLAQHVANRRYVLDLLERSLGAEEGKPRLEKVLHSLVFPMGAMSKDVGPEQNHLWLIDERFSYHTLLWSDKRMDKAENLDVDKNLRCDLLIYSEADKVFDEAWTFAESWENPVAGSIIIVEFKRPLRADFDESDNPIDQVYEQIEALRGGKVLRPDGRPVRLQEQSVPAYVYILCDPSEGLSKIAKRFDFKATPDRQGFYRFNDGLNAYVEIIFYEKLVRDAKKRNRILFEKLGIGQ